MGKRVLQQKMFQKLSLFQTAEFWWMVSRRLLLALSVAGFITIISLGACFALRLTRNKTAYISHQLMTLGYAVPGAVISVGILIPLVSFDRWLNSIMASWTGLETGLLISGSIIALAIAYTIRFVSVACQSIASGLDRIPREMDETALSLGKSPSRFLWSVHLPLLTGSLGAAVTFASIDILKELPATLILRPFNFDTLATKTFELASEEQLAIASFYAISLVLLGLLPVLLIYRLMEKSNV